MNKKKLTDAQLEALYAKAEFHVNNLKNLFDSLKGKKICRECGIDYEVAKGHDCELNQTNNNNGKAENI